MNSRRQIRIKVMQAIYALRLSGENADEVFKNLLEETYNECEDKSYVKELFYKTIENSPEFEKLISTKAKNWQLERIAVIDRILMCMTLTEILYCSEIPVKVSINESLEIAKLYSTNHSNKFINGILDNIRIELEKENKIHKTGRGLLDNKPSVTQAAQKLPILPEQSESA